MFIIIRKKVQWWKDTLLEAISPNGKVLVDVIPEAEVIIGPQPPVPILPPSETKTRFERVLILFLQAFLSKFTAVLFLDGIHSCAFITTHRNSLIVDIHAVG
jgi:predicted ATPase